MTYLEAEVQNLDNKYMEAIKKGNRQLRQTIGGVLAKSDELGVVQKE